MRNNDLPLVAVDQAGNNDLSSGITVGYLFSGYADRFGERLLKLSEAVKDLKGKMSGAVGAYNASSLLFNDPRKFEEDVLARLNLKPARFSSQIIEPEYILDLIHAVVSAFGVLAQVSDDMRNLQRSEIGEFGERFEKGQVGLRQERSICRCGGGER